MAGAKEFPRTLQRIGFFNKAPCRGADADSGLYSNRRLFNNTQKGPYELLMERSGLFEEMFGNVESHWESLRLDGRCEVL
jgi:hypothetical protein